MPRDPLAVRVLLRHAAEADPHVRDRVERMVVLTEDVLGAVREIDRLRMEVDEVVEGRVASDGRIDCEVRLRQVASMATALKTRIQRDREVDFHDVVRALEAIVEVTGIEG